MHKGKSHVSNVVKKNWTDRARKRKPRADIKRLRQELEHNAELHVALRRIARMTTDQLITKRWRYLVDLVENKQPRQIFDYVAKLSPEQFRGYLISKALHNIREKT
jgi:hypothetical protein